MIYLAHLRSLKLTPTKLIFLVPLLLVLMGNWTFFVRVEEIYPLAGGNVGFLMSLAFFHYSLLVLLIIIFSLFLSIRMAASLFILVAAVAGYFTDQLGVVIDENMIATIFETNIAEATDLLNAGFVVHVLLRGLAPTVLLWLIPFHKSGVLQELRFKAQAAVAVIAVMVLSVLPQGGHFASFLREHKSLRYYMYPTVNILYMGQFIKNRIMNSEAHAFVRLPGNATRPDVDTHHELIIMVVGESARADHFSLNGYKRQTNPNLEMEKNLISYGNISSCGTLTSISVPCMFAHDGRDDFDHNKSDYIENVLDLLQRSGVSVLWRDNNSDSKGVARRVAYEDFKTPELNRDCNTECRDTGMLTGLQEHINSQKGDILIVLHSMGSHGPAYFKRYPKEFERFTPACNSPELSQCSSDEIINAYDNTILYTDYFLSKVIELLKSNTPKYETAMFYVSDHGESLGESGLYLHGIPYMIAPDAQTRVPIITWASDFSDIDIEKSRALKDVKNSHDAVFDTLLTLFEIKSDLSPSGTSPLVYLNDKRDDH